LLQEYVLSDMNSVDGRKFHKCFIVPFNTQAEENR
jgi:hypothetical protein